MTKNAPRPLGRIALTLLLLSSLVVFSHDSLVAQEGTPPVEPPTPSLSTVSRSVGDQDGNRRRHVPQLGLPDHSSEWRYEPTLSARCPGSWDGFLNMSWAASDVRWGSYINGCWDYSYSGDARFTWTNLRIHEFFMTNGW